ncbi:MAG: glutamate--tRNA ligase [bacterium]|nr:glutamate--tRNA ligase [bacterium]
MSNKIRVRFAPSPTGNLHVGGVRTCLYNWLFARHHGGTFILRIEDTDIARSTKESEKTLLEDLSWLGLNWDEGPDIGGPHAPYRQSERLHIYNDYARKLIKENKAYYCFCTDEELNAKKELALKEGRVPQYDGHCKNLSENEKNKFIKENRKPSIRFIASREDIIIQDLIRGEVNLRGEMVGDFIIIRSQGLPTYNYAAVIDDHLMEISHVLRGEEHLPNTRRQVMIYQALDFKTPHFGHLSLILGKDRAKLSKRDSHTSITEYISDGYLPDGLLNYLAMLGWSPKEKDGKVEEILSRKELIEQFDLDRVSKSPAIFDLQKLDWVNGQHLLKFDINTIAEMALPFLIKEGLIKERPDVDWPWLCKVVETTKNHIHHISEIPKLCSIFFDKTGTLEKEAEELLKTELSRKALNLWREKIKNEETISVENFQKLAKEIQKESGIKGKDLYMPVRAALTGDLHGPELVQIIPLLTKETCLKRIEKFI